MGGGSTNFNNQLPQLNVIQGIPFDLSRTATVGLIPLNVSTNSQLDSNTNYCNINQQVQYS